MAPLFLSHTSVLQIYPEPTAARPITIGSSALQYASPLSKPRARIKDTEFPCDVYFCQRAWQKSVSAAGVEAEIATHDMSLFSLPPRFYALKKRDTFCPLSRRRRLGERKGCQLLLQLNSAGVRRREKAEVKEGKERSGGDRFHVRERRGKEKEGEKRGKGRKWSSADRGEDSQAVVLSLEGRGGRRKRKYFAKKEEEEERGLQQACPRYHERTYIAGREGWSAACIFPLLRRRRRRRLWKSELCKDRVLEEERGRNWHSPLFFRPYKKVCNSKKN